MGIVSFLISKFGKNICNTDKPHEFTHHANVKIYKLPSGKAP